MKTFHRVLCLATGLALAGPGCKQQKESPQPPPAPGTGVDAAGEAPDPPGATEQPAENPNELRLVRKGAEVALPKDVDVGYVLWLTDDKGNKFELGGIAKRYWEHWGCQVCPPDEQVPGEPPDEPITLRTGTFSGIAREATYFQMSKCERKGQPCRARVPVPPGEYTLTVEGVVDCPPRKVTIPLVEDIEIECKLKESIARRLQKGAGQ